MHALLLSEYISQDEGPIWNAVRGKGLAYAAGIYILPDRKSMMLHLYRCSKISQAYEQTKIAVV